MKPPHWLFLHLAASVAAAFSSVLFSGHSAWSQAARTIKVVVAVPAASLAYTQANIFVEQISEAFSQARGPMIEIATRTLADGTMGAEDVLHAAPDGNTVLMTSNVFIINPYVRTVHYDPLTSFEPVCYLARLPEVVVVSGTSRYRTLADLLSAARSAADVTMASFGPTGSSHIAVAMLKLAANINMKYVPYPSQVAAVNALLGEHVTSGVITYVAVAEHLKDGKLRALATASRTRIEPLPDVPTSPKAAIRTTRRRFGSGCSRQPRRQKRKRSPSLPAGLPPQCKAPEVKAKLVARGLYPVGMCGADFGDYFRKQYIEYGRVIRESGIR